MVGPQTTVVYFAFLFGMAWAWPRSCGLTVPALAINFCATAVVGFVIHSTPDQDAAMVMCDLAMAIAIRHACPGYRAFLWV
jgi:hypothetical protein